jgi:hypothetical protein
MPRAGLTQSWIAAEATLPPEWWMMGVVCGPREVDPQIHSESWGAWARGPNGQRAEGRGESPTGALDALANAMRKSGMAFKVE